MPRPYRLGVRAEQVSKTRASIVRAAVELIRNEGLRAASVPAIASAADVAPATVRNHFPEQSELLVEVGEMILQDLALPGVEIFEGIGSTVDRVTRLAHELVALYDRGQSWWFIFTGDAAMAPAFERSAARYEERFDGLIRSALDGLAEDRVAVGVVASVIGPPLHYALIGRGLSSDEVVNASLDLLVPWLSARERARGRPRPRRRPKA